MKRSREGPATPSGRTSGWTALHRLRTITWKPSGVEVLAHASGKAVAAARQSGRIELWDPVSWTRTAVSMQARGREQHPTRMICAQQLRAQVIHSSSTAAVSALAWVLDPESDTWGLVSGGLSGQLECWSPQTLACTSSTDSFGGAVWSMCAQPGLAPLCAPVYWLLRLPCQPHVLCKHAPGCCCDSRPVSNLTVETSSYMACRLVIVEDSVLPYNHPGKGHVCWDAAARRSTLCPCRRQPSCRRHGRRLRALLLLDQRWWLAVQQEPAAGCRPSAVPGLAPLWHNSCGRDVQGQHPCLGGCNCHRAVVHRAG